MTLRTFSHLFSYLDSSGIASRDELEGCSHFEIAALEDHYQLELPESYRNYLSVMGHRSGCLFTHDHYAANYEHVFCMTQRYRQSSEGCADPSCVQLPPDSLIVLGRLEEQFLMIRCNNTKDSAIWYFEENEAALTKTYESVLDWLYSIAEEAKDAIDAGYFDKFPDGTKP